MSARAAFLLAVIWPAFTFFAAAGTSAPDSVQMATEDRLQLSGWWPTKGTPAREEFVGPEVCGQCHSAKFQSQKRTPMANASSLAANSLALRSHDRLTFHLAPYSYEIVRAESGSMYSVSDGIHSISVPLGWALGLGEAGQTYIFERNGVFYESRLSYFRAPDTLDFTPGAPTTPSANLEEALGRRMIYAPETRRCFACHNTASTANNRFDPAHLIPGVTCEACHGPGVKHVAAMKAGHTEQGVATIFNPGRLKPVDLVDFCGACHRTFMDVALTQKYGILNLRFQPYRLERSQCWEKARISCLDCHDPHQPRNRDLAAYDSTCLGCHSKAGGTAATATHAGKLCAVSTKNCVSCHMPKYEMPGMHFKFTDHYIRVIREGQGYVD